MAILKANSKNSILASIILYTTGGVRSGITEQKLKRSIYYKSKPPFLPRNWEEMLKYYMLCPNGTDEDIAVTQLYIKSYPLEMREGLAALICGKISLGVTKKMAVKTFGEELYESAHIR